MQYPDVIVTDKHGGWNRISMPRKGKLVLFSDGVLNILDASGRCVDVRHDTVVNVFLTDLHGDEHFEMPKPTFETSFTHQEGVLVQPTNT